MIFVNLCLFFVFWPFVVRPSSIYGFWLPLWYLPTLLCPFGHYVVSPSSTYGFWLPLWYLLSIVLSVLRLTASDYPFGIFWSLYCLSFGLRLLITPLVSFGHCIVCPSIYSFWLPLWFLLSIVLSVLRFTASDYPFGIFWSLYCLSFDLRLLITPLVSSNLSCYIYSFYPFIANSRNWGISHISYDSCHSMVE